MSIRRVSVNTSINYSTARKVILDFISEGIVFEEKKVVNNRLERQVKIQNT